MDEKLYSNLTDTYTQSDSANFYGVLTHPCQYCGQDFVPTAHKGGGVQAYCSPSCRTKARNKRYRMSHPDAPRRWSRTYYAKRKSKKEVDHGNADPNPK